MLPMFKSKTVAAVTVLALSLSAVAPAHAWGQREQDVLKGVIGAVLIGALINQANQPPKTQPLPVYAPAPTSIYNTPAAQRFDDYSDNSQRRIQSTLSAYGYYHGSIDGSFGPSTYNATVAYANATGKTALLGSVAGVASIYDGLLF